MAEHHRTIMERHADMGKPFTNRELTNLLVAAKVLNAASKANSFTQTERARGNLRVLGRAGPGTSLVWQLVEGRCTGLCEPTVPPMLKPEPDAGPYDPAPKVEGPNNGLTTALAEHLWHKLGGGDSSYALNSLAPMEQNGWRAAADGIVKWFVGHGFAGPGAEPKVDWRSFNYAWVYEADSWEITDSDGGAVALVCQDQDVPLLLYAPRMSLAIIYFLTAYDAQDGKLKRADVEKLRQAVAGMPGLKPELGPKAETEPAEGAPLSC